MRAGTAPGNTYLTPEQCNNIVAIGQANGLLDHGMAHGGHR
jgi:hypothetical protein